ncbi:MAG: single-stranded-DNA-specific exonuclease RecJ [Idiomarinaceae bacterium HL-53]|nr:MAG: single-stranded-DNA-specific exonuclease RecJ [Idiomarinaceae bacterium HL-53]CUS49256.1 single-stranded-DNA-specific exonuclease [Idiomarinaceae bacterium HL-53]
MMQTITLKRRPEQTLDQLPKSLPLTLRKVLARRGVRHADELEYGLRGLAHYNTLRDCERAAAILARAILAGQAICIVGDFDADGASSVALFMRALQAMGAQRVGYLVPNRFTDGYGLTAPLSRIAHEQGYQLILTVDNGMSAHEGVDTAKQLGMQVVVTDHHLPGHKIPRADAVVNPNHPECGFVSKAIAGVGVSFYVLMALRAWFREHEPNHQASQVNLAQWLDLVAIGTVADVVPLDYNNRILIQQGVARIREGACQPGVLELLRAAGREPRQIVAQDIGFTVGPRINAAGRLDDMQLGIDCLLADNLEDAKSCAQRLDTLNRERRSIEQDMKTQAEQALAEFQVVGDMPVILSLYHEQWHQGVVGIVAGRIKERFYRPVIAFAKADEGTLRGSARSIPGLHMRDLLERVNALVPDCIVKFGGHAMAAGLTLKQDKLALFQETLTRVANDWIEPEQLNPVLWSDGELAPEEMSLEFVQQLEQVGPWGQKFEAPIFDSEFVLVRHQWLKEQHLKLRVRDPRSGAEFDAIGFFATQAKWQFQPTKKLTLAYRLQMNEFRGERSVQLMIEHLWPITA